MHFTMLENYHEQRAKVLGLPEGTGKYYGQEELESLLIRSQSFEEFYKKYHTHGIAIVPDSQVVTDFWNQAVEPGVINSPKVLFCLGMDILRLRLGNKWFEKNGLVGHSVLKSEAGDRLELDYIFPIYVSPVATISVKTERAIRLEGTLIRDRLNIVKNFDEGNCVVCLPITYPYKSILLEESVDVFDQSTILQGNVPLGLSEKQIQTFGNKLWKAHLSTP